jgi:hypothetical protein
MKGKQKKPNTWFKPGHISIKRVRSQLEHLGPGAKPGTLKSLGPLKQSTPRGISILKEAGDFRSCSAAGVANGGFEADQEREFCDK